MICPHCSKPIMYGISDEAMTRVRELRSQKYSVRDIEFIMRKEGYVLSFSSIARKLREEAPRARKRKPRVQPTPSLTKDQPARSERE